MSIGGILSAATSVAGLLQQRKKDPRLAAAEQAAAEQAAVSRELLQMARNYDPRRETNAAVNYAQRASESTLRNAMRGVTADFRNAGGIVGGDTAFLHTQQRVADSVLNPLAQFAADRASTEFQRKMAAMQAAVSTAPPGQVANVYQNLSGAGGKDLSSLIAMGQSAIGALTGKAKESAAVVPGTLGHPSALPGVVNQPTVNSILRSGRPTRKTLMGLAKGVA